MKTNYIKLLSFLLPVALGMSSCNKLLEVTPKYIYTTDQIYANDTMADSVVVGMYGRFAAYQNDLSLNTGLSSDELIPGINSFNPEYSFMYSYNLNPFSGQTNDFWGNLYSIIGVSNAIIEGVGQSKGMTQAGKDEAIGQAKFMRALNYYFLVNLYGDVPLVLTTNYPEERLKPRAAVAAVYTQIIQDLEDASQLLGSDYPGERVKANKWAALALLSRVYLFTKDWTKAEQAASQVIAQSQLFQLGHFDRADGGEPMDIFTKNNPEQILQLWNSVGASIGIGIKGEFASFGVTEDATGLLPAFEENDKRKENFVRFEETVKGYQINKYRSDGEAGSANNEYTSVLRLGEQYLNRAEARMQLGLSTAVDDINILRRRAGLTDLSSGLSQSQARAAIVQERRVELCFEWGDRWFTLKRMGLADNVMKKAKPTTWKTFAQLYPLPTVELQNNRQLTQNPGYNN